MSVTSNFSDWNLAAYVVGCPMPTTKISHITAATERIIGVIGTTYAFLCVRDAMPLSTFIRGLLWDN